MSCPSASDQPDGGRIEQLERTVATLTAHVAQLSADVDAARQNEREAFQSLNDLRRDHERETALLKHDVEELRRRVEKNDVDELKAKLALHRQQIARQEEEQERRHEFVWAVVINTLGVLASGGIAALVAYFVTRR